MPVGSATSSTPVYRPAATTGLSALASTSGSLRRGARGDAVVELQRALARAGVDPGDVDGKFGPDTERAVRAFQRANGLEVDGVVGRNTRAALLGGSPSPQPTPAPTPAQPPSGPVSAPVRGARVTSIGGVAVHRVQGQQALTFTGGMSINADGSPRAYHPRNIGLDALGNAGRPGNWWGIATNSRGTPYVQGPNDPAPGYYVSTTALADGRFPANDPRRYVNSETVPFIAVPPQLRDHGVKLGDLVEVTNPRTGRRAFAIVADIGPKDHLGEGSIRLAQALGINPDARRGGASSGVTYTVYPGSGAGVARDFDGIQAAGRRLTGR